LIQQHPIAMNRRNFATGIVAAGFTTGAIAEVPLRKTQPEQLHLKPNGWMPNNVLPVIIYRAVFPVAPNLADKMELIFTTNLWPPQWRNGIYNFHHYHSTAHEVLGIAAGHVNVMLGGENGNTLTLRARDVLILPTGTGHCRISASDDLLVIGAYPNGEHWDICRSAATPEVLERMRGVKFPASDPVFGKQGALPKLWIT
jgi:uncharacterized protein YjlB